MLSLQEVTNLKHVVEVRENKLVQLSKENVDLQETATILRRFVISPFCYIFKLLLVV